MQLIITPSEVFLEDGDRKSIEDIHNYLWIPVYFEGEVCLRRLFELAAPLVEFWGVLLNENVVPLFNEISTPAHQREDLGELRVSWSLEEDEGRIVQTYDFSGINEKGTCCAIEFTPVNNLADIPVKIKTEFAMWCNDVPTILGDRNPLLIELFKAIFFELSFFGSLEARDAALLEVNQAIEDIENGKGIEIDMEDLI